MELAAHCAGCALLLAIGVALSFAAAATARKVLHFFQRYAYKPAHLQSWEDIPVPKTRHEQNWAQVHQSWVKWAQEWGQQGLFRTPPMAQDKGRTIIITDPALAGLLYSSLPKDASYQRFHYMPYLGRPWTSPIADQVWGATCKSIAPFFSIPSLRTRVQVMNEKAHLISSKLRKFGPNPVEAQDAMKRLVLDTFLLTGGFSFELHALDFGPCQFLKDLHFVSWEAAICSLQPGRRLWFRLSQSWSAQSRNFVDVHARVHQVWERCWATVERAPAPAEEDTSLMACLRRLAASDEGACLTRKQLVWTAGSLLVAGLDSQALTLSFTLMCLAAHPDKQALVAAELQRLGLLASSSHPEPRSVSYDDLPSLPYLDAGELHARLDLSPVRCLQVIKESERLLPVAGLGTARRAPQAMQIGNFWIPAGTRIVLAAAIMHQDPASWAESCSFIPERWLADVSPAAVSRVTGQPQLPPETLRAVQKEQEVRKAAQLDAAAAARAKFRFASFSQGSRACPGQGFAQLQLMISLAVLVGRFKVALAPQMGGWQGCHDREVNAFTLQLIGGNWLVFTPRDAADKDEDFLIRARHSVHCSEP